MIVQVVKLSGGDGSVLQVDSALNPGSLYNLFQQLAEKNYASFCGMLKCGHLSSKVILSPAPMVSASHSALSLTLLRVQSSRV